MGLCLFRCKGNQTTTTTNNLDMIGHLALVDRYLQLSLASRTRVHTELTGLSNNAAIYLGHLDQAGIGVNSAVNPA